MTDHPDRTDEPETTRSRRGALLALAAVALLLVGVGLGLLLEASLSGDSDDADSPAANSAAVGFAQDMTRHHEQGVELAAIELEHGTDPEVRSMAFDILTAQSNEIGQMQSWLTRWGQPVTNPGETMAWMGHDSSEHGEDGHGDGHDESGDGHSEDMAMESGDAEQPPMPGMATSAEMEQFRAMRGPEVDKRFLQLMLRHHEGGLHMMEFAADPANVDQSYVRDLASSMKRTQDKEISIITQMLELRGAQPLPVN